MNTAVNHPNTVNQDIKDSLILTCQRCNQSWQRRSLDKLPKACPRCRSRYWQKPLTPYWAIKRQENEAIRQAEAKQEFEARQRSIQNQMPDTNREDLLKIYFCPNIEALEPVKKHATFWLPENSLNPPTADQLYQLGNTIATTTENLLHAVRYRIVQKQIPHDKFLWIEILNSSQMIFTFDSDGLKQSFWPFDWPAT